MDDRGIDSDIAHVGHVWHHQDTAHIVGIREARPVDLDPFERYEELSEFIYDLHHPNKDFLNKTRPPLIERNPVLF